jgi:hypothetical protein
MIYRLHDPVFGHDPVLAVGATDKAILNELKRRGYKPDKEFVTKLYMEGEGRALMDLHTGARVLRLKRLNPKITEDIAILAHEATHLAIMIYERIKTPVDSNTDEPFAYYVGFLVRESLWHVRKQFRRKKKGKKRG